MNVNDLTLPSNVNLWSNLVFQLYGVEQRIFISDVSDVKLLFVGPQCFLVVNILYDRLSYKKSKYI